MIMYVCRYARMLSVLIHTTCYIDMSSCSLVALIAQLGKDGSDPACSQLAGKVLDLMEEFPSLESSNAKTQTGTASLQLHTMAITLWNLAVTLKAKDNASNELNAQCKLSATLSTQYYSYYVGLRNTVMCNCYLP